MATPRRPPISAARPEDAGLIAAATARIESLLVEPQFMARFALAEMKKQHAACVKRDAISAKRRRAR
jgi:hypothetical protein